MTFSTPALVTTLRRPAPRTASAGRARSGHSPVLTGGLSLLAAGARTRSHPVRSGVGHRPVAVTVPAGTGPRTLTPTSIDTTGLYGLAHRRG